MKSIPKRAGTPAVACSDLLGDNVVIYSLDAISDWLREQQQMGESNYVYACYILRSNLGDIENLLHVRLQDDPISRPIKSPHVSFVVQKMTACKSRLHQSVSHALHRGFRLFLHLFGCHKYDEVLSPNDPSSGTGAGNDATTKPMSCESPPPSKTEGAAPVSCSDLLGHWSWASDVSFFVWDGFDDGTQIPPYRTSTKRDGGNL